MSNAFGITVFLIVFTWISTYTVGTINYYTQQQAVDNIVYRYTQTAGKKGELNSSIYNDMTKKLELYNDFSIELIAEKYDEDGNKIEVRNSDVIDFSLRDNDYDILTVYAKSKKNHWLSTVYKISPLGGIDVDLKLYAKSAIYIQ